MSTRHCITLHYLNGGRVYYVGARPGWWWRYAYTERAKDGHGWRVYACVGFHWLVRRFRLGALS